MKYKPGDDVIVDFDGRESPGEVLRASNGWVTAVIAIDPTWDYGQISPRLAPHSTVCVRESRVRPVNPESSSGESEAGC